MPFSTSLATFFRREPDRGACRVARLYTLSCCPPYPLGTRAPLAKRKAPPGEPTCALSAPSSSAAPPPGLRTECWSRMTRLCTCPTASAAPPRCFSSAYSHALGSTRAMTAKLQSSDSCHIGAGAPAGGSSGGPSVLHERGRLTAVSRAGRPHWWFLPWRAVTCGSRIVCPQPLCSAACCFLFTPAAKTAQWGCWPTITRTTGATRIGERRRR